MTTETLPIVEIAAQPARVRGWPRVRLAERELRILLAVADLLLINLALIFALKLWQDFRPDLANMLAMPKWWLTLSLLWFAIAIALDLYNLARAASVSTIAKSTAAAAAVTSLLYVLIPWFTPELVARSYMFGFVLLSVVTLTSWRTVYARWLASGAFYHRMIILGTGEPARRLASELDEAVRSERPNPYRGTGYQVVGLVSASGEQLDDRQVLGDVSNLVRLARQLDAHDVVVALGTGPVLPEVYEALLDCRELGIQVSSVEAISERLTARLPVEYASCDLETLLKLRDEPMMRLYLAAKRFFDLCLGVVGIGAVALLAPVVALANLLTSPGPLFYQQERIGQRGRPFRVIKFRSMRVDAEAATGAVWSAERDPRITPVGSFLRKSRLDELPQVVNVMRGEMSWVGPRPERPHFVGQLAEEIPLYRARNAVKPGITGWAQIHYGYGNSVEDSRIKLEYDLYYVRHFGLYIDLLILLRTIMVILQLKGK